MLLLFHALVPVAHAHMVVMCGRTNLNGWPGSIPESCQDMRIDHKAIARKIVGGSDTNRSGRRVVDKAALKEVTKAIVGRGQSALDGNGANPAHCLRGKELPNGICAINCDPASRSSMGGEPGILNRRDMGDCLLDSQPEQTPWERFAKKSVYEFAKGTTISHSSYPTSVVHEWKAVKTCQPGGDIDIVINQGAKHGGFHRVFICVPKCSGAEKAYSGNLPLNDPVFDDCWEELEYVPYGDSIDGDAKCPLSVQYAPYEGKKYHVGRYKLPSLSNKLRCADRSAKGVLSEGVHAVLSIQWTTGDRVYPKKSVELMKNYGARGEALMKALAENAKSNDKKVPKNKPGSYAEVQCDGNDDCKQRYESAGREIKTFRDKGDLYAQTFNNLMDIELSMSAGSEDCHENPDSPYIVGFKRKNNKGEVVKDKTKQVRINKPWYFLGDQVDDIRGLSCDDSSLADGKV